MAGGQSPLLHLFKDNYFLFSLVVRWSLLAGLVFASFCRFDCSTMFRKNTLFRVFDYFYRPAVISANGCGHAII